MGKVSVIINCYNGEKYLKEAIESVYAQTYKSWEIIFWDNCSTDGSADIAKGYDEKLRYFRGDSLIPLGYARNKAIEKAEGDYIAFLDVDDLWLPEKLEKQVELFRRDKEVGLVYSNSYILEEDKLERYNIEMFRGEVFEKLLKKNFIPFVTIVVKKGLVESVNRFNPDLHIITDYDLTLKIARLTKFDFFSEPLAKYRVHSGNESKKVELTTEEILKIYDFWAKKDNSSDYKRALNLGRQNYLIDLATFYLNQGRVDEAVEKLKDGLNSVFTLRAFVKYFSLRYFGKDCYSFIARLKRNF